jgi:hypothetical protein
MWRTLPALTSVPRASSCSSQRGFGLVLGGVEIDDAEGRHVALGPVDLVQVDHIGLQPAQAGVARGHDVGRRHATAGAHPGHAARRARDLGGQHHLLARARVFRKPVADDGLGGATGLGLRAGTAYISAVSMKLTPRSSERFRMAWALASSTCSPKVMVPRQMGVTCRSL